MPPASPCSEQVAGMALWSHIYHIISRNKAQSPALDPHTPSKTKLGQEGAENEDSECVYRALFLVG